MNNSVDMPALPMEIGTLGNIYLKSEEPSAWV